MGHPSIRYAVLEQLASDDLTVKALSERIGALRNSVAKSIEQAHEHGILHIAGYDKRIPIYRRGPGQDASRPPVEAPEAKPVLPVVPVLSASLEYFEIAELPGVRHFKCDRYRATLSVSSCSDRWQKANATLDPDLRLISCRGCPIGASHSGKEAPNESRFLGKTICGRCHRGATRLIGKHLCVSCMNRQYEYLKGKNAKGTVPVNHAALDRRSLTYRAGNEGKTLARDLTVDTEELVIATLRDESSAVTFGFKSTAMHALFDDELFDRSIPGTSEKSGETDAVTTPIAPSEGVYVEHVVKPATA